MNKPMAQQTAVEWLMTQFPLGLKITIAEKLEQAKQMEKEQIVKAWDDGDVNINRSADNGEQYYTETYGK